MSENIAYEEIKKKKLNTQEGFVISRRTNKKIFSFKLDGIRMGNIEFV